MWWWKLPLHKSCPNEKLLAPMNFLHADVEPLCFLLMLRARLLQLCATGAKWHPARAQQWQLGVYLLPACLSVRSFVCLAIPPWLCSSACLAACWVLILYGVMPTPMFAVFLQLSFQILWLKLLYISFEPCSQLCICCGTQTQFPRIHSARMPVACPVIDICSPVAAAAPAACLLAVY